MMMAGIMLRRVLVICREVNLKLNKDKCYFRCSPVPFFSEVISRHGVKPDPRKQKTLTEMPPSTMKIMKCKHSSE